MGRLVGGPRRGDKCIHIADSLFCTVETDITVNQLHSNGGGGG